MDNIFTQKQADRLNDAKYLLELIALAVDTKRDDEIALFNSRSQGICLCCRIIQELIKSDNE